MCFSLRRISQLPLPAQLQVQFCARLAGSRSSLLAGLAGAANCKQVYRRFGRHKRRHRTRPGHFVPEVGLSAVISTH